MAEQDLIMEHGSYTSISLTNEEGTYIVIRERTEMMADEIVEILVIPLLLAVGYSREGIDAAMGRGE